MTNPIDALAKHRVRAESVAAHDARINEAARLAESQIGGRVGEEIRNLLIVFYGTDSAQYVDELAKAIITEHGGVVEP